MDTLPEWTQAAPEGWEPKLRAISPIAERTSWLHFRWRSREGLHVLYELTPKALLSPGRIEQLTTHWSDLPSDQHMGRKLFVSEYQHYMFRTHGVEARLHWVLQGEAGGTPAMYTHREQRLLQAVGAPDEVPEIGSLLPCPFDERAIQAIAIRDRLRKAGGSLDALHKSNTGEVQKMEESATEQEYRKAFLGWWFEQMIPNSEFMKTYLRNSESDYTLRKATKAEANAASMWKDHFLETGNVIGATHAGSRIVVPVARSFAA